MSEEDREIIDGMTVNQARFAARSLEKSMLYCLAHIAKKQRRKRKIKPSRFRWN
jgi:hypothetical protein